MSTSTRASALGCPILIDDFGVGFGSLTYVQQLRGVCCLKIDRAFVTNLTLRRADQHIVTAVVNLADSLGQHTVAEGIESQDTLEPLRSLGVHSGQGYLLGVPQPAHLLFEASWVSRCWRGRTGEASPSPKRTLVYFRRRLVNLRQARQPQRTQWRKTEHVRPLGGLWVDAASGKALEPRTATGPKLTTACRGSKAMSGSSSPESELRAWSRSAPLAARSPLSG